MLYNFTYKLLLSNIGILKSNIKVTQLTTQITQFWYLFQTIFFL